MSSNNNENQQETPLTSLDHYRLLGKSGLRVSPLCLGTMTFGTDWNFGSNFEECKKMYDYFVEKGGNFVDTANLYTNGESERFLGQLVAQHRSQIVVATKYTNTVDAFKYIYGQKKNPNPNSGGNHRKSLVENLDDSLKRMNLGCVDILYLHNWEYRTPIEEVLRAMDDVVRAGKCYYVAISDVPAWVVAQADTIAKFRGWSPLIALQTRYNLIERTHEAEFAPMCKTLNIGVIPWGVAAEGFLTGKYTRDGVNKEGTTGRGNVSRNFSEKNFKILDEVQNISAETKHSNVQVVTNWLLQKKTVTSPLVGARTLEQLKENIAALDFKLTPEQMNRLDSVSMPDFGFPHSFLSSAPGTAILNPMNQWNAVSAGAEVESRY